MKLDITKANRWKLPKVSYTNWKKEAPNSGSNCWKSWFDFSMRGYAIHAGYVRSKTDGDKHFISYGQLINLYGLDPSKCFDGNRPENWRGRNRKEWHIVRPDHHGRYNRFRQSNNKDRHE